MGDTTKKNGLLIAGIVLEVFAVIGFILFIMFYSTSLSILAEANSAESEGSEGIGHAFGLLIMLPVTLFTAGADAVLNIFPLSFGIATLKKKDGESKKSLPMALVILSGIMILAIAVMIIALFARYGGDSSSETSATSAEASFRMIQTFLF